MVNQLNIELFLKKAENLPVIDVRSPKEYNKGHIPNAFNIPLFDNEERALVGTTYKHISKEESIITALKIAGPKLVNYVKQVKKIAKGNELLVHCWRGGMRSIGLGWLFYTSGIKTSVLVGGYKAYRSYIRKQFDKKAKIIILGGKTGCGKSEILHFISKFGHQVIDFESLAHHKGSAFGALGQSEQPSNEQFENNLYEQWRKLDLNRPVWMEDESKSIGRNRIPDELFYQMRKSDVIKIELDKKLRIQRLVKEYANFDTQLLRDSILKISKRIGGLNTKRSLEALEKKEFHIVADITLHYYDKAYNFGLSKRNDQTLYIMKLINDHHEENGRQIILFAEELKLIPNQSKVLKTKSNINGNKKMH